MLCHECYAEPAAMPDCPACSGTGRAVLDPPNAARVSELGSVIAGAVRDGRRVLVRCSGGLNRSGVVVAEALVQLDHPPAEAVRLVRAARGSWALTNPGFVAYLSGR